MEEVTHPGWALVVSLLFVAVGVFLIYCANAEKKWAKAVIQVPGTVIHVNEEKRTEKIKNKNDKLRGYQEVIYYSSVISFSFEDEERKIVHPLEKNRKDYIGKTYQIGIDPSDPQDARVIDSNLNITLIIAGLITVMLGLLAAYFSIQELLKSSVPPIQ